MDTPLSDPLSKLTPAERRHVYEEEKARIEIEQARLTAQRAASDRPTHTPGAVRTPYVVAAVVAAVIFGGASVALATHWRDGWGRGAGGNAPMFSAQERQHANGRGQFQEDCPMLRRAAQRQQQRQMLQDGSGPQRGGARQNGSTRIGGDAPAPRIQEPTQQPGAPRGSGSRPWVTEPQGEVRTF